MGCHLNNSFPAFPRQHLHHHHRLVLGHVQVSTSLSSPSSFSSSSRALSSSLSSSSSSSSSSSPSSSSSSSSSYHIIISIIIKFISTYHHCHQFISLLLQLRSLQYNISRVLLAFVPPPWPQVSTSPSAIYIYIISWTHDSSSPNTSQWRDCHIFGDSGMEAAFWEASIQQYLLASQCWAHLGAIVVPGIALQWLWSPGFGDLSGFWWTPPVSSSMAGTSAIDITMEVLMGKYGKITYK